MHMGATMPRISKSFTIALFATTALSTAANAQDTTAPADEGEEIIVTGTRAVGTQAAESAAPIQLLSDTALEKVGQPNLNQALTQLCLRSRRRRRAPTWRASRFRPACAASAPTTRW